MYDRRKYTKEIIRTENLTKKFGDLTAVDGISLSILQGEVFGLLGPNGAGKTTLLSMLCTIMRPTSGTALINGYDIIKEHSSVRRSIGIVFQDPSIDTDMTARENLQMHADLYGVPVNEQKARIKEVLVLVGLFDKADSFLNTFSGGMRRRLEIARGLLHHPRVLFLDEPTIGLDPRSRDHIWDYIRSLKNKEDMTIILTTHYMEEADRLCDRIAIVDKGRIVVLDTPSGLKQDIGGDTLTLVCSDPSRLRDLLIKEGLSSKFTIRDKEITVFVDNVNQITPRILEVAYKAGIFVEFISASHPDMNDVFIHHTEKGLSGGEVRENSGRLAMMKRRRIR